MQYLNNQQIILGVISNFDERLHQILINTNLQQHFDFILTSYDHGREKPDISIFKKALNIATIKHGSEINQNQALHIGDNLRLDYTGAKNAGWNAIIIKQDYESNDEYKNIPNNEIFHNIGELKTYFQNIFN